jgi:UDP-N-acetyl-D-glucosamine dehydrogenase
MARIRGMTVKPAQVLAIIGQGYVGLPLAMAAVNAGWIVIGVDNLETKVDQINRGASPVEDISDEQLQRAISSGAYRVTNDFSSVKLATVVTICVPTPLSNEREPDLEPLRNAAIGIAPYVANKTLIVSESTSYPGTLRDFIIPIIESAKAKESTTLFYASAPERVNPGDQVWNQKNTPRLIGGINEESKIKAHEFYSSICDAVVVVSSPEVAEAAKLLENTFRLVNIALVNEFVQLANSGGINATEVFDAASTKPYGFMSFRPGVGVGGHCIPVDPLYLTWWARSNDTKASFVELANNINLSMPNYVANRALSLIEEGITTPRILILGVAYKPGIKDVRESPVLALRDALIAKGAEVAWFDPLVPSWEGTEPADLGWDCDLAILATNQPGLNLDLLVSKNVKILDCTNSVRDLPGVILL